MKPPKCYCIFYLERKYYHLINRELKAKGYKNIRAIVPTLKILKKSIKGKMFYDEVPILFNYGFIKMPVELAYSRPFLTKLRKDISGIRTWLRSTETMHPRKKKRRIDNAEDFDDFSKVATCSKEDVRRFKRLAHNNKRFSLEDILSINIGDYVVLKVYPYEGVDATVLSIDQNTKTVELMLYPENGKMQIRVPFDHVLYSVYQNYDPELIFTNPLDIDTNRITSEAVDNFLDKNRI